jgi:hypothetical protein
MRANLIGDFLKTFVIEIVNLGILRKFTDLAFDKIHNA